MRIMMKKKVLYVLLGSTLPSANRQQENSYEIL